MKYIKEYNSRNLLEELEDYLQEFFDEFNIVKYRDGEEFESYRTNFYWITSYQVIRIELLRKIDYLAIKKHLTQIQPLIEKRLGNKIIIFEDSINNTCISIYPQPIPKNYIKIK